MSQYEDDRAVHDELSAECSEPLTASQQRAEHAAYTQEMIRAQEAGEID